MDAPPPLEDSCSMLEMVYSCPPTVNELFAPPSIGASSETWGCCDCTTPMEAYAPTPMTRKKTK